MKITNKTLSLHELGQRKNQEDSIFPAIGETPSTGDLYILCDGMGGHERGEVASSAVCQAMSGYINEHPREDGFFDEGDFNAALAAAYDRLDSLDDESDAKKMGTTLTFLKFHKGGAFIAHIGDSRIYHIRPLYHKILHVTKDHSLVNDLIDLGELTPEEARTSRQKNVITRAMQPHQERRTRADCMNIEDVKTGDYFYMCSDGMLEISEDKEILNVISMPRTDKRKISILKKVTENNADNHSAHLVHVTSVKEKSCSKPVKPVPAPEPHAQEQMEETAEDVQPQEEGLLESIGRSKLLMIAVCVLVVLAVAYIVMSNGAVHDAVTGVMGRMHIRH